MIQNELFNDAIEKDKNIKSLGYHLYLKFSGTKTHPKVSLYHRGLLVKNTDISDHVAKKLLVVEAIELGANKSSLASALNLSRQTIHNYSEAMKNFGIEGLIRTYNPSKSKKKNREEHAEKSLKGNKARQLEQMRKEQREKNACQLELQFGEKTLANEDQPYSETHDWESTRYAGIFTYIITLIHLNNWLQLTSSFLGDKYKLCISFVLMIANNIRSIEQLKNLHKREGGVILGIRQLPGKTRARIWLYTACKLQVTHGLLSHFFQKQIRAGIVGVWVWFVDGHLLPYTGKQKVHQAFNTQRDMVVPGRNNIVVCDGSGRIVDFEIQEGKGDMRAYLIALGKKWKTESAVGPVLVFDREAYGGDFFYEMTQADIEFVTWEKHIDVNKLKELREEQFVEEFEFNGKTYKVFEGKKQFPHNIDGQPKTSFALRRIYIWNVSCDRRTCALANIAADKMSTEQCASAILNRWGASENTFKHIADKHPLNYQPGYSFTESQKQEIANPEVRDIKKKAAKIKTKLVSLYKKLSKCNEVFNKDGSIRTNSARQKLLSKIKDKESEIDNLNECAKQLPEKVDISLLEDYSCFQRICDESKYLFDFVTASVWNARKQMVEWLLPLYENKNEYVDLFYAITNCHGWIKSETTKVTVRLEPLQQPSRLAAQQQFCRKLTQLRVITPGGKLLEIEVGDSPIG